MDYLKLTFSGVDEQMQEMLIAQLSIFNFIGFEQREAHLLAYAEHGKIDKNEYQSILETHQVTEEVIPEVNWNEKWERDFEPIVIKDQVAIRAHFHEEIKSVKHEIIITPKMSFGTGHHATTQLMLTQMTNLDWDGKKVLDYGTGTGVLSVYAEQLGAAFIIANDIDPWSEENANENAMRNACKHIDVRLGGLEVIPEDGFDGILANINLNVLKESMETLFLKLKKGCNGLIISGVLQENEEDIINIVKVYSADYKVFKMDKWLCVHINF